MVSRQCLPAAGFLAALALLGVAVLPRPVSAVVDGWAAENATARIFADIAGAGYDARTRPGFSRAPTNISAQFRLNSLFAVDPVATSFTLDVGLLLQWTDPRLLLDVPGSYPLPPTQDIRVVGSVDLGNGHGPPHFVWTPDVYFENQISRTVLSEIAKFNPATGGVLLRRHFLVELKGDFDFHSYPFDRQWLPVWLTPWSYNSDEVTMYWAPSPVWPVVNGSTFKHTVWDFETYTIEREVFYSRENLPPYDRLKMNILISRRSTSYIIKVILPIILLVSLTAVNFWLSVDAVTDRLALVITLILTIVSFYNSVSQELPLVNYPVGPDALYPDTALTRPRSRRRSTTTSSPPSWSSSSPSSRSPPCTTTCSARATSSSPPSSTTSPAGRCSPCGPRSSSSSCRRGSGSGF
ncbi:neurotransmitter-gated ion-channel ligand-binding domain-containing protein [Hyaloraphidium curvatum]|nr:neurotransmitter-gated ion-channel ligand-binding domain-containing protein [Hyaloraphidium curvatum]